MSEEAQHNEHLPSVEEALSECERELHVRTRCYDRWISEGKLSSVDARDRRNRMEAAVVYLRDLLAKSSKPGDRPY